MVNYYKKRRSPLREKPKKLPVALTDEEFRLIIKHTNHLRHKVAFLLGYGAGLRVSEVCNLKKEHINTKDKRIFIKSGKGGKDRVVPLPKGFKESYLSCIPLNLTTRALQHAFFLSTIRSGVRERKPNVSFHSLRHSFGSRLANNGVPIHHIRTLMGHSNISTTNVYLELNPKQALKSYEEYF
jgi:integrase/recombinase XerD